MLVVLQQHVVMRAVLLDQVGLEDQRLDLVAGRDELQFLGQRRELAAFPPGFEVLRHARTQVVRLPDVNGLAALAEQVNAGRGGQHGQVVEMHTTA